MIHLKTPWLIDGLWQRGKINGLSGAEKAGKSRLVGWLIVGMSRGQVLGMQTDEPVPKILYLAGEETIPTVNQRITDYAALQGIPKSQFNIEFIEAAGMRLDLRTQRVWLEQKLLDDDFQMLLIDPLIRVHGAKEVDNTAMSVILNDLRKWSNKLGITVVVVHHTAKVDADTDMTRIANWFRGASDIAAILDTAQYVQRIGRQKIRIKRQGRFPPLDDLEIADLGDLKGFSIANPTG